MGVLGVRSAEKSASGNGYRLTVTYPSVARGGLAAPWSLDVVKEGGFADGETVRLRLDGDYFDLYDENGFDPDPSSSTAAGRYLYQEYEAPDGDTLTLSFDARIEPAAQRGKPGTAAVLDDDGRVLVEVSFRTTVLP